MDGHRDAVRRPLVIGLTGPIGCGKTTVARMLADCGGMVIDADVLARRATEAGRATLPRIRERFGRDVIDPAGELDRSALARIVFADPGALADLEAIIHPEVRRMLEEQLASPSTREAAFVVIEAIKLVEGGLALRCDVVWLIECLPAQQRERLAGRGAPADDVSRRLEAQGIELVDRLEGLLGTTSSTSSTSSTGPVKVRRLSTDGSLEETRGRVEDYLAEAFEA